MHAYYFFENVLYFRGMETNPNWFLSGVTELASLYQSYSIDNSDASVRNSQSPLQVTLSGAELEVSFGHKKRVSESETLPLFGGDEWARTTDSRIFSPMLYQLSYITALTRHKSIKIC